MLLRTELERKKEARRPRSIILMMMLYSVNIPGVFVSVLRAALSAQPLRSYPLLDSISYSCTQDQNQYHGISIKVSSCAPYYFRARKGFAKKVCHGPRVHHIRPAPSFGLHMRLSAVLHSAGDATAHGMIGCVRSCICGSRALR